MSNIDKQALRLTAEKAKDNFMPNFMVPTRDVLALLDELEAKDSSISTQQHEIRTLLNALEQATEKRNSDIPGQKRLIGWRASDYTDETSDPELAKNWAAAIGVLPIFEGDVNTKLSAAGIKGSRDMAEFTKEQLIEELERRLAVTTHYPDFEEAQLDAQIFKIALEALTAGMEQEPVAWLLSGGGAKNNVSFDSGNAYADPLREVTPLYTAPPAPVSVPAAMEIDDDFDSAFEHGKAVGWNACRAAMLQSGNFRENKNSSTNNFREIAETSTNYPVIPDGLSTVCAEAYQVVGVMADALGVFGDAAVQKVLDNLSQQKLVHRDVLPFSLPVTPDGWISCSDRMPNDAQWCVVNTEYGYYVQCWSEGQGWLGDDISIPKCDVINWMPLPEPPQG